MRRRAKHLVCCRDNLGIHLVATLRLDQFGNFAHRIDGAVLEIALTHRAQPILAWITKRSLRRLFNSIDGMPVLAGDVIARIVGYGIVTLGLVLAFEALGFSLGPVGSLLLVVMTLGAGCGDSFSNSIQGGIGSRLISKIGERVESDPMTLVVYTACEGLKSADPETRCAGVQKPNTCSTTPRLYQLRSKNVISPPAGRWAT